MMQSRPGTPGSSLSAPMQPQPGPSTYSRAPKGKACLNCRRRKLKCDCARPVCSQCIRYGRERDCEYTDRHQLSRTEMLEETIATLRARVRELEHPGEAGSSSIILGDPRSGHSSPRGSQSPGQQSLPSGLVGNTDELPSRLPDPFDAPAPTYSESQALINAFIPSSIDVGFFLNPNRWFCARVAPASRPQQPIITEDQSNPLLWAIYAWGARFTDDPGLDWYAQPCLKKALQLLSTPSYLGLNVLAASIIHRIQAEVLVANYLFNEAHFVEARQHVSAAASLALTYGLHKIRPPHMHDPSLMHSVPSSDSMTSLPPSMDSVEEGERICAFWQVYVLDKTWSSVLGKPSFINETGSAQTYIDTPWPLAVEQYAEGPIPQDYGYDGRTLHRFLYNTPSFQVTSRLPTLALRAQAAALLDRATVLSSSCVLDPTLRTLHSADFDTLMNVVNTFIVFLAKLRDSQAKQSAEWARSVAITHCVVRLAVMQLHYAWFDEDLESALTAIGACKAVEDAVKPLRLRHTDPLLAIILTSVAQLCCDEELRIRNPTMYKRQLPTWALPCYLSVTVEEMAKLLTSMGGNSGSKLCELQREAVQTLLATLEIPNPAMRLPTE